MRWCCAWVQCMASLAEAEQLSHSVEDLGTYRDTTVCHALNGLANTKILHASGEQLKPEARWGEFVPPQCALARQYASTPRPPLRPAALRRARVGMQMFEQLRAVTMATQDLSVSHSNARARMVRMRPRVATPRVLSWSVLDLPFAAGAQPSRGGPRCCGNGRGGPHLPTDHHREAGGRLAGRERRSCSELCRRPPG